MAVYEQSYRRYRGPETPRALRFLTIPRYAFDRLSGSRIWWVLLAASTLATLGAAVLVYLRHNASALAVLGISVEQLDRAIPMDARFFSAFLGVQFVFGFLVVLVAGPSLMSMDLANGALPLYLSRPIRRVEYVVGKFLVLAAALSLLTWVYGLGLFGLQTTLGGAGWAVEHARIAWALFAGSWLWIVVMSAFTLALSAMIRWPLAVRGVLLALFILLPGFAHALAAILDNRWGLLLDPGSVLATVVRSLFGLATREGPPLAGAWLALGAVLAFSALVLFKKLRAYEVVRS